MSGVDVRGIRDASRVRILRGLKGRYGYRPLARMLGISLSSMHRYLNGVRRIPDKLLGRMLEYVERDELIKLLSGEERLKALGLVNEYGSINYGLMIQLIKMTFTDEYLKNLVFNFVVKEYREDLKKLLGVSLATIESSGAGDSGNSSDRGGG